VELRRVPGVQLLLRGEHHDTLNRTDEDLKGKASCLATDKGVVPRRPSGTT
jgi:hypothetical protein